MLILPRAAGRSFHQVLCKAGLLKPSFRYSPYVNYLLTPN